MRGMLSWWSCHHQLPIAAAFWIIWIVSMEECSSLMQNLMQSLLQIHCSTCSHFECNSHTVHIFTQWHLLPPLTSTVKSSLFTHEHSSPLSLTARLYQCCTNHSCYINNGWTFSRQTIYIREEEGVKEANLFNRWGDSVFIYLSFTGKTAKFLTVSQKVRIYYSYIHVNEECRKHGQSLSTLFKQ